MPAVRTTKKLKRVMYTTTERRAGAINGVLVPSDGSPMRYTLPPNQEVKVEEEVYAELKRKYGKVQKRLMPDIEANLATPHARGEDPIMMEEPVPRFIIQFLDG